MSDRSKKQYSSEFKESSVKLAIESTKPITQTARELGVKISTLHTWISKQTGDSKSTAHKVDNEQLYAELKKLKKEIAQITMERDILKKATAYFARQTL